MPAGGVPDTAVGADGAVPNELVATVIKSVGAPVIGAEVIIGVPPACVADAVIVPLVMATRTF